MKVICQKTCPSNEQNIDLGYGRDNTTGFELTIGMEYTVLGINFQMATRLNKGTILLLRDDIGRCAFVPLCLLEVSNDRPSKFWRVKKTGDYNLRLWPEEFFMEYFFDYLSDGVAETKNIFDRVCQMIEREELHKSMGSDSKIDGVGLH